MAAEEREPVLEAVAPDSIYYLLVYETSDPAIVEALSSLLGRAELIEHVYNSGFGGMKA